MLDISVDFAIEFLNFLFSVQASAINCFLSVYTWIYLCFPKDLIKNANQAVYFFH